ncbi:MAG TPA: lipo-like protein [Thermoanaerobaculia bacterium]|jgi:hypothetical protein
MILPGDVLLVDGDQRVSEAVKYLSQSSWSHSALYVGDALLTRFPERRGELTRRFGREARHLLIEALADEGVVASPLSKYDDFNVRLCRPIGLSPEDRGKVIDHVVARLGATYDRRNFLDLTRYLMPFRWIPPRLREDALHFGSGKPTETICSTLLAEAFGVVRFPILPVPVAPRRRRGRPTLKRRVRELLLGRPTRYARSGLLQARHPTLCVPRDFDLSPYFAIIKIPEEGRAEFDYRKLRWKTEAEAEAATPTAPSGRPRESG